MKRQRVHRVVVAPDKFRGSLDAPSVARRLAEGIYSVCDDWEVAMIPVADGGEGTVAAAVTAGFVLVPVVVPGPTGSMVEAAFAMQGHLAILEMAQACGRDTLPGGRPAPLTASTFGVGSLVAAALDRGATSIILGAGGSATTDGGSGMLAALGARMITDGGDVVVPTGGGGLQRVAEVDISDLDPRIRDTTFVLASDVDSPLLGPRGAAAVFGPQKGATPADVHVLEVGLCRYADALEVATQVEARDVPGAGSAGGLGFAALACLGATARSGAEVVFELVGLFDALEHCSLAVTGEGRLDEQTLAGKVALRVAAAATEAGVPTLAVAGDITLTPREAARAGFARTYSLTDLEPDVDSCMAEAGELLVRTGASIAHAWLRAPTQ
jgi:glycerate kinase